MSYCRWSSDNWKCDLYCYEDVMGCFTTHVASNRVVGDPPAVVVPPHPATPEQIQQFMADHRAQMAFLEATPHAPIGLPHDGESFGDLDLLSFLDRVMHLRDVGYHVPQFVIDDITLEIAEGGNRQAASYANTSIH